MEIGVFTFVELTEDPHTGQVVSARQRVRDVIELGELADQAGLSVFGIGEHHRSDFAANSPAVLLSAIAARTEDIRLTSAVTVLSSADPVSVFEDFTALDLVSGGRAEVMAGRGAFTESFPLFGYRLEDYDALFEEKVDLLLRLRDNAEVTWSGRFRPPLHAQEVYPRPVQDRLPVWIGVGGTVQSVVRAGRLGTPMALAIIGGRPRQFVPLAQLYRTTAAEAGHAEAPIAITSHTFVGDTSQAAADTFFDHYRTYLHTVSRGRFRIDRAGYEAGRGLEGALFVGSPEQIVEKILHQHELFGHQRFLAQISLGSVPHADAMRGIELLGSKVLPAVRAALG
ncbi:LLM class flavin-dependent oxidoreductase [Umezawaea sp. NPDC059074]|uniref:LLM class flavin-dependent oxidoreductase n=1 Tax=Umezawaea sp. NPDC059074 TaxID=3346716 RepID=UPI00369ED7C8